MIEGAHSILSSYAPALITLSGYLAALCGASEQERERKRQLLEPYIPAAIVLQNCYCKENLMSQRRSSSGLFWTCRELVEHGPKTKQQTICSE